MAIEYLDKDTTEGAVVGRTSSSLIGFYGVTPNVRQGVNKVAAGDASGSYGSSEATLLNEIKEDLNRVITQLEDIGLIRTS